MRAKVAPLLTDKRSSVVSRAPLTVYLLLLPLFLFSVFNDLVTSFSYLLPVGFFSIFNFLGFFFFLVCSTITNPFFDCN